MPINMARKHTVFIKNILLVKKKAECYRDAQKIIRKNIYITHISYTNLYQKPNLSSS